MTVSCVYEAQCVFVFADMAASCLQVLLERTFQVYVSHC